MAERWSYPVPQAMQRHTGCRFAPPPKAPSPPSVPEAAPAEALRVTLAPGADPHAIDTVEEAGDRR